MKKTLIAAASFLAVVSAGSIAETRRYVETIGKVTGERIVTIEKDASSGMVTIDSLAARSGARDVVVSDARGSAVSWKSVTANGETQMFSRKADVIEIGAEGRTRPAKGTLDGDPWFASMDFGLSRFVADGGDSMNFWVVNPHNGKTYKMDARRMKAEALSINGKDERAVRVEITVHGVPSIFYSMDYWFRESDSLFVRFEGTYGGPGSPKCTLEFAGEI